MWKEPWRSEFEWWVGAKLRERASYNMECVTQEELYHKINEDNLIPWITLHVNTLQLLFDDYS